MGCLAELLALTLIAAAAIWLVHHWWLVLAVAAAIYLARVYVHRRRLRKELA